MIVVGIRSGTSFDHLEVALCEITGAPPSLQADVLASLSIPWPVELNKMMLELVQPGMLDGDDLCLLDVAVGEAFAAGVLEVIASAGYYPEQIDLIGAHGPTIRHEVREDGRVVATLQIGQPTIVTEWTGITTVSHFRQRDVAAGGQGAPLVGYVDWLLLRDPERYRAVQYIKGIASMVWLPPLSAPDEQPRAFEIGPGTVLIDYAAAQVDKTVANNGSVNETLLDKLLADAFLQIVPPKSVSQFAYTRYSAEQLWHEAHNQSGVSPADILATFTAFTVQAMTQACETFLPKPVDEIILAGDGRQNTCLVEGLQAAFAPIPILSHEDVGMDTDSKEAMGVAILAYETWHNRPCTLPSLTGVQKPIPLGCIQPGTNYQKLLKETWLK